MPQYFDKPQSYAPFLESEIAFNSKKPLLTVMPSGYGFAGLPRAVTTRSRASIRRSPRTARTSAARR